MRDMFGAVLLGAVIGAAATMFYLNNEKELCSAGRNLKENGKQAISFLSNLGQDIEEFGKRQS